MVKEVSELRRFEVIDRTQQLYEEGKLQNPYIRKVTKPLENQAAAVILAKILGIEYAFDPPEGFTSRITQKLNNPPVVNLEPLHKKEEAILMFMMWVVGDDEDALQRLELGKQKLEALANPWDDPEGFVDFWFSEPESASPHLGR